MSKFVTILSVCIKGGGTMGAMRAMRAVRALAPLKY